MKLGSRLKPIDLSKHTSVRGAHGWIQLPIILQVFLEVDVDHVATGFLDTTQWLLQS